MPGVREARVGRPRDGDDRMRVGRERAARIEVEGVDVVARTARQDEGACRFGRVRQRDDAGEERLPRIRIARDDGHRRGIHDAERIPAGRLRIEGAVQFSLPLVVVRNDREPPVRRQRESERVHPDDDARTGGVHDAARWEDPSEIITGRGGACRPGTGGGTEADRTRGQRDGRGFRGRRRSGERERGDERERSVRVRGHGWLV